MPSATKQSKTFGEWWSAHYELLALLGLGLLIVLAAIYGVNGNVGAGA